MACWSTELLDYEQQSKGDGHTVRVSLDLNNHLLQTPHDLFPTFFWHLLGKEFLGAASIFTGSTLGLISRLLGFLLVLRGDFLVGSLLEALGNCTSTGLSIKLRTCNFVSASGGGISAFVHCGLNIFLVLIPISIDRVQLARLDKTNGGFKPLGLFTQLGLDLVLGNVGLVMPDIFLSWLINLGKGLLVGLEFAGGVGCGIAGNVAEENDSITYYERKIFSGNSMTAENRKSYVACGIRRS